jgi:hypothetical protein
MKRRVAAETRGRAPPLGMPWRDTRRGGCL